MATKVNDFNDYLRWVRQANQASDAPISDTALRQAVSKDWDNYDAKARADFAAALRDFWEARRALENTNSTLRESLGIAMTVEPDNVKDVYGILQLSLGQRDDVILTVQDALLKLGGIQKSRSGGDFEQSLASYLQVLQAACQQQSTDTRTWLKFDPRQPDMADRKRTRGTTRGAAKPTDAADRMKKHAAVVLRALDSDPTLAASAANSSSSSKRGHDDSLNDQPENVSKKARLASGQNAQVDAQQQTLDKTSPPNTSNAKTQAEQDETGEDQRVRFPRPHGEPGENARWLFREEMDFAAPFHKWCLQQLIAKDYQTMSDLEDLAEAFYIFYENSRLDHDWHNEEDVPFLPMRLEAYENGWDWQDERRNWTNVRRLYDMIRNESDNTRDYFLRHLCRDVEDQPPAVYRADKLIEALLIKGQGHDWSEEADQWANATEANDMRAIDPEGVAGTGKWAYWANVGEGGNGRAVLYVKMNANGRILQRLIVKESYLGVVWNSTPSWHGRIEDRKPIEAGIHEMVPLHRHIIEYLGFHVLKQLRMVRHYTAYAELGDLSTIFKNHAITASLHDQDGKSLLGAVHVPIVAVLCVFEAMAASVCLMAHGALPIDRGVWPSGGGNGDAPAIAWEHNIIHQDIKLPNYFLSSGPAGSKAWSGLPIAALGDFGNSIDMSETCYRENPSLAAREQGTPRWMAPEQLRDSEATYNVSAKTNVYQVGLSMLQLMALHKPQYQVSSPPVEKHDGQQGGSESGEDYWAIDEDTDDEKEESNPAAQIPEGLYPRDGFDFYPKQIVKLATACIQFNPGKRPSPKQLYMSVRNMATRYSSRESHSVPYQFQEIPAGQLFRIELDKHLQWLA